jgi:hypothetical protein
MPAYGKPLCLTLLMHGIFNFYTINFVE